jgi:ATP-dependent Clp protease ATP-binding subunit ClpX
MPSQQFDGALTHLGPGVGQPGRHDGERLGRLPVRVQLDGLSAADLVAILTQPREAMVPEYQRLCALDQIQLEFTREALFEIANAALKQKLGARALRAILEKVLHPILFVGPERAGERIVVEPEDVRRAIPALS